jgi:hypothetical protein
MEVNNPDLSCACAYGFQNITCRGIDLARYRDFSAGGGEVVK